MWAEIIVSRDDLARLLTQALPLTIQLGDAEAEHSLVLSDLGAVSLVPEQGLRIQCKARVHWPVLGIDVPVILNSLTVLLLPSIGRSAEGDTLVFRLSIEHADFSAIPTLIDNRLTDAINAKLASSAELSWNFSKTLTYSAALPTMLDPLEQLALRPAWGKLRITEEALVYAVSFHTALVRRGEPVPLEFDVNSAPQHTRPPLARAAQSLPAPIAQRSSLSPKQVATIGVFGLGAGAAYFALKASFGERN